MDHANDLDESNLSLGRFKPCARVSKIKLQNHRYRYLLPDEESRLLAQCTGKRKHLATMIRFTLGTGACKSEQLTLKVQPRDFFRNLVDMNSEVKEILVPLCGGKQRR